MGLGNWEGAVVPLRPGPVRGAHARIRTGDLLLTKEMLYRLSYVGAGAAQRY